MGRLSREQLERGSRNYSLIGDIRPHTIAGYDLLPAFRWLQNAIESCIIVRRWFIRQSVECFGHCLICLHATIYFRSAVIATKMPNMPSSTALGRIWVAGLYAWPNKWRASCLNIKRVLSRIAIDVYTVHQRQTAALICENQYSVNSMTSNGE